VCTRKQSSRLSRTLDYPWRTEYYEAYLSLPKDVERADFFRYMVVLRHGGVYADIDTECRKPIDDFVRASDTLVVGWENEFATDDEAYARHFVRRRQILQWLFMGVPGHPVLRAVCDHVASKATVSEKEGGSVCLRRRGVVFPSHAAVVYDSSSTLSYSTAR